MAMLSLHVSICICFYLCLYLHCCVPLQVARQLFEPLVMQLIHWFTSGKMYGSDGTQILLVTIMVSSIFVVFYHP